MALNDIKCNRLMPQHFKGLIREAELTVFYVQGLNNVEIIETLASTLKKHKGVVYNVVAITTAKVPIVKFKHARTQLEGDISLYNTLVSDSCYDLFAIVVRVCDIERGSATRFPWSKWRGSFMMHVIHI